jgi:murein DD-endopeptidase MepM/ murein hydrolase activator NlpD
MPAPPQGWNNDPWRADASPSQPQTPSGPMFAPQPVLMPVPDGHYRVQPGDTLLGIARQVGRKSVELQAWNQLSDPNLIQAGQVLRVRPSAQDSTANAPTSSTAASTGAERPPTPTEALKPSMDEPLEDQSTLPAPARYSPAPKAVSGFALQWPAEGKVVRNFNQNGSKGLEIQGLSGDAVYASHAGRVAFSGQLRGYGTIVLIKGSEDRMTAYAQLGQATAKEGQLVRLGDRIGFYRRVSKGSPSLYFEVREKGQPTNPSKVLPPRS